LARRWLEGSSSDAHRRGPKFVRLGLGRVGAGTWDQGPRTARLDLELQGLGLLVASGKSIFSIILISFPFGIESFDVSTFL
jgi:hypothetical protein